MKLEVHTNTKNDMFPSVFLVFNNIHDATKFQFETFLKICQLDNEHGIHLTCIDGSGRAIMSLINSSLEKAIEVFEREMSERIEVEHYHDGTRVDRQLRDIKEPESLYPVLA